MHCKPNELNHRFTMFANKFIKQMCSKNTLFTFFFLSFIILKSSAVEISISNNVNGLLSKSIERSLHNQVTKLSVNGLLDARDFKFMRDSLTLLESVDLKDAQVLGYQGDKGTERDAAIYVANAIPQNAFSFTPANGIPIGKASLKHITLPNSITKIGLQAFAVCGNLLTVDFPNTAIAISEQAFADCSLLESFPTKVDTLEQSCFQNCTSIQGRLNLPLELNYIGISAFDGCSGISELIINSEIKTIPNYSFNNCSSLHTLKFLQNIDEIQEDAFAECTAVNSITLLQSSPPLLHNLAFPSIQRANCIVNLSTQNMLNVYQISSWAGFNFKLIATSNNNLNLQDYRVFVGKGSIRIVAPVMSDCSIYSAEGHIVERFKLQSEISNVSLKSNVTYLVSINRINNFKVFVP